MLEIKNVFKKYKTGDYEQIALDGVSLTLRDNEFVAILGPSGSGKTTLLNIIGGLDHYDDGDLIINGVSTKKYRDRDWDTYRNHTIGFVFQSYNLIPHQSVLSNVELAMTLSGISPGERKKRALSALEKVGLKEQAHKKPNQMSGGQMQRVAIARALVNEPDIILADEPTGALDSETSIQIMDILRDVAKDRLVVMVTHNPELAQQYATRIVRVKDGRIVADSNPVAASELLVEGKPRKWTKLGFMTALGLSMNNLMTKKGRTFLTAFAGAIGIIGIALILSLSNGVNQYIEDLQNDMLGTNPIQLTRTAVDLNSLMDLHSEQMAESTEGETESEREENKVYSSNIVGASLTTTSDLIKENDLSKFKVYLDSRLEELSDSIDAVEYTYDLDPLVYRKEGDEIRLVAPGSILDSDDKQASMMAESMLSSSWQQLITDPDLRNRQYELLAGEWPTSYDQVALIISSNDEISDYTLYSLGVMDRDRLQKMVDAIENEEEYDDPVESFTYDDLLGREYQVFAPYQMYAKSADGEENGKTVWIDKSDDTDYLASVYEEGLTVHISCILRATEDADIASGVAYDSSLPLKLMDMAADSEIVKQQIADPETNVLTGKAFEEEETEEEDKKSEETEEEDKKSEETAKADNAIVFSDKVTDFTSQVKFADDLGQILYGWQKIEEETPDSDAKPVSKITAVSADLSNTGLNAVTLSMDSTDGSSGIGDGSGDDGQSGADGKTGESSQEGNGDETGEVGRSEAGDEIGEDGQSGTGGGTGEDTSPEGGEDDGSDTETETPEESVSYNIVFVDYDGSILLPLTAVEKGTDVAAMAPADPSRADTEEAKYIFVGWRSDADNEFYTSQSLPAAESNVVYTALYYEFTYNAETKQWQDSSGFSYDDLEKIMTSINEQSASAAENLQNLLNSLASGDLIDAQQLLTALQNSGISLNDILNALGVTPQDLMDMLGISSEDIVNAVIGSMSAEDLMKLMGAGDESSDLSSMSTEDLMKLLGIDSSSLMSNMSTEDLMKLMGIDSSSLLGSMSQEDLAALLGMDTTDILNGLSEDELKELFGDDFDLGMSDDALAVLLAQMSGQTPTTYEDVLASLGYYTVDDPSGISIYPVDIAGKQAIEDAIADYNDQVANDTDKVTYTDLIATLTTTVKTIVNTISYVLIAFVAISLIVSSIMIAIITYISVLERTKEIGVLRALGASKRDVSKIFNAETFIEGLISGLLGVLVTELLCIPITAIATSLVDSGTFTAFLQPQAAVILICISVILTLIAGFFPSRIAAKKDPVIALRSE